MFHNNYYFSGPSAGKGGPKSLNLSSISLYFSLISLVISGRLCFICVNITLEAFYVNYSVPNKL